MLQIRHRSELSGLRANLPVGLSPPTQVDPAGVVSPMSGVCRRFAKVVCCCEVVCNSSWTREHLVWRSFNQSLALIKHTHPESCEFSSCDFEHVSTCLLGWVNTSVKVKVHYRGLRSTGTLNPRYHINGALFSLAESVRGPPKDFWNGIFERTF